MVREFRQTKHHRCTSSRARPVAIRPKAQRHGGVVPLVRLLPQAPPPPFRISRVTLRRLCGPSSGGCPVVPAPRSERKSFCRAATTRPRSRSGRAPGDVENSPLGQLSPKQPAALRAPPRPSRFAIRPKAKGARGAGFGHLTDGARARETPPSGPPLS